MKVEKEISFLEKMRQNNTDKNYSFFFLYSVITAKVYLLILNINNKRKFF